MHPVRISLYPITMQKITGGFTNPNLNIGIVAGRFNEFVVDKLIDGAEDALVRHGVNTDNITLAMVPGAYEIPLAVKKMAESGKYDAIVALGAVIRGSTPHFDYVAGECAKGIGTLQLQTELPIAFGVLTVDTIEQAIERSGTKAGNKGAEAALTAMEMVDLLKQL